MSELKRSIETPFGEAEKEKLMEKRIREVLEYGVEWELVKNDTTCLTLFIISSEGKFFTFVPRGLTSVGEALCFGTESLEEAELLYNKYKRQYEEWEAKKREFEEREAQRREAKEREEEKRKAEEYRVRQHELILLRAGKVPGYDLTEDNINIIKTDDNFMNRFIIESQGKYFTFTKNSLHFISDSLKEAELFYKMDQKSLIIKKKKKK